VEGGVGGGKNSWRVVMPMKKKKIFYILVKTKLQKCILDSEHSEPM